MNIINITLHIKTGKEIPLVIEADAKVQELKEKICKDKGIKENIKIFHDNTELESFHSLQHYGIRNGVGLDIKIQPKRDLNITIRSTKLGQKHLQVQDTITVKEIRHQLKTSHNLGIIADLHDICLDNGDKIEDEDLPVYFYGLSDPSVLCMRSDEEFRIRVSSPRRSVFKFHFVPVRGTTSIDTLKKKTVEAWDLRSENDELWNPDYVVLFLQNRESFLEIASSEVLTVKDYKLKHNDLVYMLAYDRNEWFNIRYGKDYTRIHGVRRSSDFYSILSLKLAVQDQLALPVNQQIIKNKEVNVLIDNDFAKDANELEV